MLLRLQPDLLHQRAPGRALRLHVFAHRCMVPPPRLMKPALLIRSTTAGSLRITSISRFTRSRIGAGTPVGAASTRQPA